MATRWSDLAGTVLGYLRLGKTGVRLKNNAGVLAVRDATDSADAGITASTLVTSGNATLGDSTSADSHTINGATVVNATSASAALRVQQNGAGNALEVFDVAADTSPFVVDALGRVVVGDTASRSTGQNNGVSEIQSNGGTGIISTRWSADAIGAYIQTYKSRSGTTGTRAGVQNGDSLMFLLSNGELNGTSRSATGIYSSVDGVPDISTDSVPGRLVFLTTPLGSSSPIERVRIGSNGNIGIGVTNGSERTLAVGKNITGGTSAFGIVSSGTVQSDVTTSASTFLSRLNTAAEAFTLTNFAHIDVGQGTIGAGSSVTSQFGYFAASSLTGATNNFAFYGAIAAGTRRWNFYAAGTADNAFAGNTRFGGVTAPTVAVDVTGAILASTTITATGNMAAANLSGTNTGDQSVFSTIAVSGQPSIVADTTADTLTLAAGTGITLTTNATTDTVTIAATAGDGSTSNVLSANKTIVTDTSYIVLSYLDVGAFDLTVEGNLGIL
jgi:hypothetical protein